MFTVEQPAPEGGENQTRFQWWADSSKGQYFFGVCLAWNTIAFDRQEIV